jgi:hypothetical protein
LNKIEKKGNDINAIIMENSLSAAADIRIKQGLAADIFYIFAEFKNKIICRLFIKDGNSKANKLLR